MTHYLVIKGTKVKVEAGCYHPEAEDCNGCPTGYGDCETCRYGQAVVSIKDLFELQDEGKEELKN